MGVEGEGDRGAWREKEGETDREGEIGREKRRMGRDRE